MENLFNIDRSNNNKTKDGEDMSNAREEEKVNGELDVIAEVVGLNRMEEEYLLSVEDERLKEEVSKEVFLMRADEELEREEFLVENNEILEMEELYWMSYKEEQEQRKTAEISHSEYEEEVEAIIDSVGLSEGVAKNDVDHIQELLVSVPKESEEAVVSADPQFKEQGLDKTSAKKKTKAVKNMKKYRLSKCKGSTRKLNAKLQLKIVNSYKSGRKLIICKKWIEEIGNPSHIQVGYTANCIVFSKQLHENKKESGYFVLRPQGNAFIVYCSDLVHEITDVFGLDFSDKVSITFTAVRYDRTGKNVAALVKVA